MRLYGGARGTVPDAGRGAWGHPWPVLVSARPSLHTGFGRVLCAAAGTTAADQAAALLAPGGTLAFSDPADADRLVLRARRDGLRAAAIAPPAHVLEAAAEYDLLVLDAPGRSRAQGALAGDAATFALHRSPVPVALARRRDELGFPSSVMAASSGPGDGAVVATAAGIAARHDVPLTLVHTGPSSAAVRHALAEQATVAGEVTGHEPVVLVTPGEPAQRLPAIAASIEAGLLVTGSGGRRGLAALASVSERVAHRAPCSVLVLRPREARTAR